MDTILAVQLLKGFGALVLFFGIFSAPFAILGQVFDRRAKRVARAYCAEHGLEIVDIEVHKYHYGLRLMHQGKKAYVRFRVGRGRRMEWVGPVPEVLRPVLLQGAT